MKRLLFSAVIGGLALNLAGFLTFGLLGTGLDFNGVLTGPGLQNSKVVAVWHHIQPLPLSVTDPLIVAAGYFVLSFVFVLLYILYLYPRFSQKKRMYRLFFLFLVPFFFWEFNTPINLMGQPFLLVLLDTLFWVIMAAFGSAGIVLSYDAFKVVK